VLLESASKSFVVPVLAVLALVGGCSSHLVRGGQAQQPSEPRLGLEIVLPDSPFAHHTRPVPDKGYSMGLVERRFLKITNPGAAGDLTAVDVWATAEGNAVRVRLSIIYNDLKNQEWWKDKKEKILGSFLIPEGESFRPAELAQFGIEPFEMKVVNVRPAEFGSGEGPPVVNKTKSLEVVRVEKSLDHYKLVLKNGSDRNIAMLRISSGNSGRSTMFLFSQVKPGLAPGATYEIENLSGPETEKDGVTISTIVFDDFTFEGDPKFAQEFLAQCEGIRLQTPQVLRLVEQALAASDADLPAAFEKLEAQLWVIPEAIDKPSALELLKTKFPSLDERSISWLYERLKGGLYEARNFALSPIGQMKRIDQEMESRQPGRRSREDKASYLRQGLERLKKNLEGMMARLQR